MLGPKIEQAKSSATDLMEIPDIVSTPFLLRYLEKAAKEIPKASKAIEGEKATFITNEFAEAISRWVKQSAVSDGASSSEFLRKHIQEPTLRLELSPGQRSEFLAHVHVAWMDFLLKKDEGKEKEKGGE